MSKVPFPERYRMREMTLLAFERSRAWYTLNWNVQAHFGQHLTWRGSCGPNRPLLTNLTYFCARVQSLFVRRPFPAVIADAESFGQRQFHLFRRDQPSQSTLLTHSSQSSLVWKCPSALHADTYPAGPLRKLRSFLITFVQTALTRR